MSLLTAQLWWRKYNDHVDAVALYKLTDRKGLAPSVADMKALNDKGGIGGKRFHYGRDIFIWTTLCGFIFANSISIKWTGLATPGMIAVESFFALFFLRRSIPFLHLLAVAAVSAITYITYFYIHFALLPNSGDGDAFMRIDFQRALVNNSNYDPIHKAPGFWSSFYYVSAPATPPPLRLRLAGAR